MGRLIEESRVVEILQQTWLSGTIAHRFIDDIKRRIRTEVPTVEAIPKADYETRLKADMAAMLTELQSEIKKTYLLDLSDENNVDDYEDFAHNRLVEGIISLIQQKINELKEQEDEP